MAELTKETIKYLSQLSRIHCTDEEAESLLKDLRRILDYVEHLNELDTEDVPACSHVIAGMANVMREDEIGETLPTEKFLANSPEHVGGMVKVPTVIQKGKS